MKSHFLLGLLGLIWGCSSPDDPSTFPIDEQIHVIRYRPKLYADGKDTTIIVARLPKDADLVDVSFSTSAGTFIYSGGQSDKQSARLVSGDYRYAMTILQAGTAPFDSVYITAEVTQARNHTSLSFVK